MALETPLGSGWILGTYYGWRVSLDRYGETHDDLRNWLTALMDSPHVFVKTSGLVRVRSDTSRDRVEIAPIDEEDGDRFHGWAEARDTIRRMVKVPADNGSRRGNDLPESRA